MKGKFRILGHVGLALFVACALMLAAVPAAKVEASSSVSNVWVQLTDYVESGSGVVYSIYFTPGAALTTANSDTISVIFPTGTTLGSVTATVYPDGDLIATPDETAASAPSTGGTRVTVKTPVALSAGVQVLLKLTHITNPATTGADTGKTLQVYTSQELTKVTSMGYTIEESSAHPVTSVTLDPTQTAAGVNAEYIADFTASSSGALTSGWGKVTVIFPPEVTLPASMLATDVAFDGSDSSTDYTDCAVVPTISGRFVTITVSEVLDASATGLVKFKQAAGILNPTTATTGNKHVGKVYTSVDAGIVDVDTGYDIVAASISQLVFVTADSAAVVAVNAAATLSVKAKDEYGNLKDPAATITIALSSTSGTGVFDATVGGTGWTDTTDELNTSNVCTFDYKDTAAGSPTITAAESPSLGWTDATWDITVEAAHVVSLYDRDDVLVGTYTTIQAAIDAAMTRDTIKVGPGTYTENLTIGVARLTLESTDGRDTTIIDASVGTNGIEISKDRVTVDGFTVVGDGDITPGSGHYGIVVTRESDTGIVTVQNNTVTDVVTAIVLLDDVHNATVSGNLISDCHGGIFLSNNAEDCTVSNNTITDCEDGGSGIGLQATTTCIVTGNTVSNCGWGIHIGGDISTSCEISDNTLTGNRHDGIKIEVSVSTDGLSITRNNITANEEDGIFIASGVTWGATNVNVIMYNNIYGNGLEGDPLVEVAWLYDIESSITGPVVATYNWWGDATGPSAGSGTYASLTAVGSGDAISKDHEAADYEPWLHKSKVDVVNDNASYQVHTIRLVAGWNTLSTPVQLMSTANTIGDLIPANMITGYWYDAFDTAGEGNDYWEPLTGAYELKACDAVYVKMSIATDVLLKFDAKTLSTPSKELAGLNYTGWNLISLAYLSSSGKRADYAVASVKLTAAGLPGYSQVISPSMNASQTDMFGAAGASWAYSSGQTAFTGSPELETMFAGLGYWIYMLNDCTLAGFEITPIVPDFD